MGDEVGGFWLQVATSSANLLYCPGGYGVAGVIGANRWIKLSMTQLIADLANAQILLTPKTQQPTARLLPTSTGRTRESETPGARLKFATPQ